MKKIMFLWMSVLCLTITGLSSCSGDDDADNNGFMYESNPKSLNGTWHLVSASYGLGGTENYQGGEVSVTFNELKKTMIVDNKQNTNFLKSGNFPYEITTEKRRIYTYQWVDLEYQVITIHYTDEAYGHQNIRYIYNFHDGMLVLDGGIDADGPGYYFKKLKSISF